jgi:hypothetical protein
MDKEQVLALMRAAYLAGFKTSGEGYNYEYPFETNDEEPENTDWWVEERERDVLRLLDATQGRTDIPKYPPHPFAFETNDDDPRNG